MHIFRNLFILNTTDISDKGFSVIGFKYILFILDRAGLFWIQIRILSKGNGLPLAISVFT